MQNLIRIRRQILALVIAILVIINSFVLIAISTATDEESKTVDISKVKNTVAFELEKYVNYNVENQKGALIQFSVTPGIELEEGEEATLKAAAVLINIPKINNELPKTVETIGNTIELYDSTTGELKVATTKDFKLILNYGENCYVESSNQNQNTENVEKPKLEVAGKINTQLDVEDTPIIKSEYSKTIELEEKSGLISADLQTTPIYNGFIKNKIETKYTENYDINISKIGLGDETTIEITNSFGNDKINYVSSLLAKSNIQDILGNNGVLTILDEEENEIAKIDKNTEVNEKGLYEVKYPENTQKIIIKTTQPQKVGKIRIQSVKQIPAEVEDKTVNKIETVSNIKIIKNKEVKEEVINETTNLKETITKVEKTNIYSFEDKKEIAVKESTTQVNLKIEDDKYTWTNERQNELNLKLELPINSNKYNLFKDPIIEIKLPEEVEKVVLDEDILNTSTIMYENGLELKSIEYNAETKTIKVELTGEQKEYFKEDFATGTTIEIPAIVILSQGIETKEATINVDYTNTLTVEENEVIEQGTTQTQVNLVNFTAPVSSTLQSARRTLSSVRTLSATPDEGEEDKYKVDLSSSVYNGNEFAYTLTVTGHLEETSTVRIEFPEYLEPWSYSINELEAEPEEPQIIENNVMVIEIEPGEDEVEEYSYVILTKVNLEKLWETVEDDNLSEIEASSIATLTTQEKTYTSNENITLVQYKNIVLEMDSETKGQSISSNEGDNNEISYTVTLTNVGQTNYSGNNTDFTSFDLALYIPEQIKPITVTYNNWKSEEDEEGNITLVEYQEEPKTLSTDLNENGEEIPNLIQALNIPNNETITMTITGNVKPVMEDTEVNAWVQIINTGSATFGEGEETTEIPRLYDVKSKESNKITNTLLEYRFEDETPENPDEPEEPIDNPDDPENPTDNYTISGIAWLDENEDGTKQDAEEKLQNMEVLLVNSNDEIVSKTNTNENGEYNFSDIESGNYLVIFKYNVDQYRLTTYQKSGVSEDINSDVVKVTKTIEDVETTCAQTNLLTVNSNLTNIDIGLITNKKFDFIVENYISKVTTATANETTEKTYNKSGLAKVEIKSKEINGAKVDVEYKIVITNAGELSGTVGRVIDYIPEGMKLASASSTAWTTTTDGNIVNRSLASRTIEPGESVELTLVLTKTMDENSTGTFKNRVEIQELTNRLNKEEESTENNSDKSELIISISTGAVIYVSIVLVLFIALMIFLNIKFKVFKTIKFRMFSLLIITTIITLGYGGIKTAQATTVAALKNETRKFTLTARDKPGAYVADTFAYTGKERYRFSVSDTQLLAFKIFYVDNNTSRTVKASTKWIYVYMTDYLKYDNYPIISKGIHIYDSNGNLKNEYTYYELGFTTNEQVTNLVNHLNSVWGTRQNSKLKTNKNATVLFLYTPNDWRVAVDRNQKYPIMEDAQYGQTVKGYVWKSAALCIDSNAPVNTGSDGMKFEASTDYTLTDSFYEGQSYGMNCYQDGNYYTKGETQNETTAKSTTKGTSMNITGKTSTVLRKENGNNYIIGPFNVNLNIQGTISITLTLSQGTCTYTLCNSTGGTVYNPFSSGDHEIYFSVPKSSLSGKTIKSVEIKATSVAPVVTTSTKTADVIWVNTSDSSAQRFITRETITSTSSKQTNDYTTYSINMEIPPTTTTPTTVNLKIVKQDSSSNKLSGITFKVQEKSSGKWVRVYGNRKYHELVSDYYLTDTISTNTVQNQYNAPTLYSTFETNTSGETITITGLPIDKTYVVYEVGLGDYEELYSLGTFTYNKVSRNGTKIGEYAGTSGTSGTITVTATNTQNLGAFKIQKTDSATGKALGGFGFKVKVNGGNWLTISNNQYTGTTSNFSDATTIYTNSSGVTADITKVPLGNNYDIYEVEIPSTYQAYYSLNNGKYKATTVADAKLLESNKSLSTGVQTSDKTKSVVTIFSETNKTTLKLTGTVWEDGKQGKSLQVRDNKLTNSDLRIEGIRVYLKEYKNGTTTTIATTTTDSNGTYTFTNVDADSVKNGYYYIQFIYDGIVYEPVTIDTGTDNKTVNSKTVKIPKANTSKATEVATQRTQLNNKFPEINGSEEFLYDTCSTNWERTTSKVKLNNNGHNSLNANIDANTLKTYYTNLESGYNSASEILNEVPNLNLGLYQREMPDLALVKDAYSANVQINGQSYTYYFGKKLDSAANNKIETDTNNPSATKTITSLGVSLEDDNLLDPTNSEYKYSLPIYEADVNYLNDSEDDPSALNVTITYAIGLVNNSQTLYTKVNEINELFSKNLDITEAKLYSDKDCTQEIATTSAAGSDTTNWKQMKFNITNGILLAPNTTQNVFIKMTLPKSSLKDFVDNELYANEEFINNAEIGSYSIYSNAGTALYAGYDYDSKPNNFVNDINEDDNDSAPGIKLVKSDERSISGYVFEDRPLEDAKNNDEILGDGIRDVEETAGAGIKNVLVELVDEAGNVAAQDTTDENGKYTLSDFIPGKYRIKFTWGDKQQTMRGTTYITTNDYKSTIVNMQNDHLSENEWYLNRNQVTNYSEAKDDFELRQRLDQNSPMRYSDLDNLNVQESDNMVSYTNTLNMSVEVTEDVKVLTEGGTTKFVYDINSIDLGLIERPKQQLTVTKGISKIKIMNKDGGTLVDTQIDPDKEEKFSNAAELLYTTYLNKSASNPNGTVKVEIDLYPLTIEVTYKVTIKNTSEKDYNNTTYYYYGHQNASEYTNVAWNSNPVKIQAVGVYDYLNNKFQTSQSDSYSVVESSQFANNLRSKYESLPDSKQKEDNLTIAEEGYNQYKSSDGENVPIGARTEKIQKLFDTVDNLSNNLRNYRLNNKKVLNLTSFENQELIPGQEISNEYTLTSQIASSKDDINLNNEVEISDVKNSSNFGRNLIKSYGDLTDIAEELIITPSTGGNKDNSELIMIAITSLVSTIVLAFGIVGIKKKILK